MPYSAISELPANVKDLPDPAKEIYMKAFNSAFDQHKGDEQVAHKIAWSAVKQVYKQNPDGEWVTRESVEVLYPPVMIPIAQGADVVEIRCPSCGSDRFEPEGDHLSCVVCKTLVEKSEQSARVPKQLKEVNKTEDGAEYPASAYAYVPDPEQPSTWKLRMWEDPQKKMTRAQLGKAAAALSPGGFRGQKVDIPNDDLAAVKRKVRSAYKSLGVVDEEIPKWVKESESRELLIDYVPLTEAKLDKGRATVTVIKPGFNSSGDRYYPAEVLKRDYKIFEGMKMYADHPTSEEDKARPERSIKDWVATLTNVVCDESGIVSGVANIIEPWLMNKLASLRDRQMLSDMGISINAVGNASKGVVEGRKTLIIEKLVTARSVDFVTEPGAGGVVTFYESHKQFDIDLVDLPILQGRRPDLVRVIEANLKSEIQKEVKKQVELEEQVKQLTAQIGTLTQERDTLKARMDEATTAKAKADTQAAVAEALSKAELPQVAKDRIVSQFKDATSLKGLEEAIKEEKDYIAKLSESGKVKNLGPSSPSSEETHKALVESFKRLGMSDAEAEIAAKG